MSYQKRYIRFNIFILSKFFDIFSIFFIRYDNVQTVRLLCSFVDSLLKKKIDLKQFNIIL